VNLILFESDEIEYPLSLDDRRTRHVIEVLRRAPGESFDAGLIDGPRGKATVVAIDAAGLHLSFAGGEEPPLMEPVTLLIGLPRPQTARKILEEATALGVQTMHFVATERGDPNYGQSRLWSSSEWRRHLIAGAEQAFSTRLPAVTWGRSLAEAVSAVEANGSRLALDNYEAPEALGTLPIAPPVTLAIGPERGWAASERELMRRAEFRFVHLGERVLRVETACVAAIALVRGQIGRM
jgi:16S rRNA (uracil1498-N3)-methyltransferase